MVGKQSSENKLTTLECMVCGYREVFTEQQFKFTDGLRCCICNGPVNPTLTRPGEKIRNRRMKKQKDTVNMSVKIEQGEAWIKWLESTGNFEQAKLLKWLVNKAKLVERMDKALAFYADPKNHEWGIDDPWVGVIHSEVMMDSGEVARKARGISNKRR